MSEQGKCEIHGIWLDLEGKCHFCDDENPQKPQGSQGVKTVGGGPKTGVKEFSKREKNG